MDGQEIVEAISRSKGWDFQAYADVTAHGAFDRLMALNGHCLDDPEKFGRLHVNGWMRFGNSIFQILNWFDQDGGKIRPAYGFEIAPDGVFHDPVI
jgi:hypothetical protein